MTNIFVTEFSEAFRKNLSDSMLPGYSEEKCSLL